MNLVLAIETASDRYQVVLGHGGQVIFDSVRDYPYQSSRDLAGLVSFGLNTVHADTREIASIALDIGPGGLSYVRSGVSFANALAFSLGIPIYPFNYFEIIGTGAQKATSLPVLCAIPAAADQAYVGLFSNGSVKVMRFGSFVNAAEEAASGLVELAVAGRLRGRLTQAFPHLHVVDSSVERPDANVLFEMSSLAQARGTVPALNVTPLNEQAAVFYAQI